MVQAIQRSFTSGEIAPALRSRADMNKYATGLALCQNMIVRPQGGVYSRPGMRFVGELADSTKKARLIEFSFNTEQTYILVFEEFKIRIIKDGGYVLDGGGPAIYEVTTPYTEEEIPRIGFTQSADVMTLVHPDHDPRNLSRTADDAWSLDVIDYSPGLTPPIFGTPVSYSITNVTLTNPCVVTIAFTPPLNPWITVPAPFTDGNFVTIEGVVGTVELNNLVYEVGATTAYDQTAGVQSFELDGLDATGFTAYVSGGDAIEASGGIKNVGSGGGSYTKTYRYVVTAVDEDGVESLPSAPTAISSKSLSVTYGVRLNWQAVTGTDYYRVYKEISNGTGLYGWIGDSNELLFEDYNIAPVTSDAPPSDRRPFDDDDDKPGVVNYYQQRQVFANTYNEPQTVYTTQTANSRSFRVSNPTRDDDAVTFTIAANQVNEIRHILALDSMILLTSGGEWITTEGQDEVFTPATVGVRIQSYNGVSWVPPVVINSTAIYVQEKGARVRDLGYEFTSDKYTGNDLSIMSEHLFEGYEISEMTYAAEPYGVVWCVRDDGVLLGLTYQREHQVWGWHQHNTDGQFESVAVVSEDRRDALYAIVKRNINGTDVRYVERMEPRYVDDAVNSFFVDSGLSYNGAPVTEISGLDHLEGKDVSVLADGNVVKNLTVSGGAITLQRAASVVHVGLPYVPAIETLDIDNPGGESLKGKEVTVSKLIVEFERSRGGFAGPIKDDGSPGTTYEFKPRFDTDGYNSIQLKTFKDEVVLDPLWSLGGGVRIEQRDPLPMTILSVIPEVDVGGS